MKVAVLGAGAAGVAAAWRAARLGAAVTQFHDRAGATTLSPGALDLGSAGAPSTEATELIASLGVWQLAPGTRLATQAGVLRSAAGRDRALLDLTPLAGRRVAVLHPGREDWDGELLAAAWSRSEWALQSRTRFSARPLELLTRAERGANAYDLALALDARAAELGEQLAAAGDGVDAWLTGPWLGTRVVTCERIARAAGVPVGEALCTRAGVAGERFRAASVELLGGLGVELRRARACDLQRGSASVRLTFDGGDSAEFDAVIVAVGGVLSGGIVIEQGARGAEFRLALNAPLAVVDAGEALITASTLHGIDFVQRGAGLLESVGIDAFPGESIAAAGDVVAAQPRTLLAAVEAGIAAANAIVTRV